MSDIDNIVICHSGCFTVGWFGVLTAGLGGPLSQNG